MRSWIAAAFALMLAPMSAQAQKPEVTKVHLGVGGKTSLYYLPLTVTERLGYFKEAGLDVEISDFQGGAKSLQALMGGSVEVVTGSFDHTIQMQAKGQPVVALVQLGRFPGIRARDAQGEGRRLQEPEGPQGHEDRRHGAGLEHAFHGALHDGAGRAEAGGRVFHRHRLGQHGRGGGEARRGRRDLERRSDDQHPRPRRRGEDRRRHAHAGGHQGGVRRAVSGGGAVRSAAYIEKNPNTVQALVSAFVRGLKWVQTHSPEEIAKVMPEEYALGDKAIYLQSIKTNMPAYSPDGRFTREAAETAYKVLKAFDPNVQGATIDLAKTYTDRFVDKANAGN